MFLHTVVVAPLTTCLWEDGGRVKNAGRSKCGGGDDALAVLCFVGRERNEYARCFPLCFHSMKTDIR